MKYNFVKPEIRETVLDAAEVLLQKYGYKKTTMDDLAKEAGVGKGTLYLYYPSKEEMLLSVIDRHNLRLVQQLKEIAAKDISHSERLIEMLSTRVIYRLEKASKHTICIDELFAAIRPLLMDRREKYYDAEKRVFAEVLTDGKFLGILHFDDAMAAANDLIWSTNSMLPFGLSPRELGARDEVRQRVERIARLLLRGLTNPVH